MKKGTSRPGPNPQNVYLRFDRPATPSVGFSQKQAAVVHYSVDTKKLTRNRFLDAFRARVWTSLAEGSCAKRVHSTEEEKLNHGSVSRRPRLHICTFSSHHLLPFQASFTRLQRGGRYEASLSIPMPFRQCLEPDRRDQSAKRSNSARKSKLVAWCKKRHPPSSNAGGNRGPSPRSTCKVASKRHVGARSSGTC